MQKQLLKIAKLATNQNTKPLRQALIELMSERGGDWEKYGHKMLAFLEDGVPRFTVFAKGNSKLPFYAFSALPIITCPGFGDCGSWCYSFKAWRYPAAFFRQLQNTILILRGQKTLAALFQALPKIFDFRLYVDGDFDSLATMRFWFNQLELRPDIRAYGYSKSWPLFLSYNASEIFPKNYKLNLSGGSRYNGEYLAKMKQLDCVRGEFVAFKVSTKQKKNAKKYAREVKQAAKQAGHKKIFVCPGKCGDCVRGGGHACGNEKFNGVSVAIGIH